MYGGSSSESVFWLLGCVVNLVRNVTLLNVLIKGNVIAICENFQFSTHFIDIRKWLNKLVAVCVLLYVVFFFQHNIPRARL